MFRIGQIPGQVVKKYSATYTFNVLPGNGFAILVGEIKRLYHAEYLELFLSVTGYDQPENEVKSYRQAGKKDDIEDGLFAHDGKGTMFLSASGNFCNFVAIGAF